MTGLVAAMAGRHPWRKVYHVLLARREDAHPVFDTHGDRVAGVRVQAKANLRWGQLDTDRLATVADFEGRVAKLGGKAWM